MNPSAAPENPALDERVATAVAKHQRRLRLLTGIAWGLALLAVAASVIIVFLYFTAFLPKEKQILDDMGIASHFPHTGAPVALPPEASEAERRAAGLNEMGIIGIQLVMTRALSMGTMFIACAVGSLALGTLVVLVVMMRTSRATMSQVQAHLALISAQLQGLRTPPAA